jgi:hypothetical protein
MKFEIVQIGHFDDTREAIGRAYESLIAELASEMEFDGWPETTVRSVLGGVEQCRFWGVTEKALGFHAVAARKEDEDGEEWYEVNEHHEVHLNLDCAIAELSRYWDGETPALEREIELESLLVTAPHELLHVIDWLKAASGRTPLEVFDEEDGEASIMQIQKAIAAVDHGCSEDRIERVARDITTRICQGRLTQLLEAIGAAMGKAPVPGY